MGQFSVLPVGKLMLDSFEPSVDTLAPFAKFVEERPEGDHENPIITLDFLDILASLDTWSRCRAGNGCIFMHFVHFRFLNILSTSRPDSIPSPPRLVFSFLLVLFDVSQNGLLHEKPFFHAGFVQIGSQAP